MDEKLTNEAAEMIGQYTIVDGKNGKDWVLAGLLQRGGIVRKGIQTDGFRKPGCERVFYYFPDGGYATYDPARLRRHKKLEALKEKANIIS